MRVRWFSSSRSCPVVNGEFLHAWTSCSRLLFEKRIVRCVRHLVHKSPPLFTEHWVRWIQSTSFRPVSIICLLIFPSQLLLCLPNGLFPSGFSTNTLYVFLSSTVHATCPFHLVPDLIMVITYVEDCRLWSFSPFIRSTQNCNYSLRYWSYFCAATSLKRGQAIIRSTQNCNYSLRYWSYFFCVATSLKRGQAWPRWREVATQKKYDQYRRL